MTLRDGFFVVEVEIEVEGERGCAGLGEVDGFGRVEEGVAGSVGLGVVKGVRPDELVGRVVRKRGVVRCESECGRAHTELKRRAEMDPAERTNTHQSAFCGSIR